MEIQVVLDNERYIESYSIITLYPNCTLNNSITITMEDMLTEDDIKAFEYTYDCYKVIDNEVIFDGDKLTRVVNSEPEITNEQKLENRITELEKIIKSLVSKG